MAVVNDYTALISGKSWSGLNALNAPVVLTYSFASQVPSYLRDEGYSSSALASFQPFSATEQAVARDALRQWADVSGIAFVEVTNGPGELVFSKLNIGLTPQPPRTIGFAKFADRSFDYAYNYDNVKAGDVFIDLNYATETYVLLHEIGHALGLKHPFDGDPVLSSTSDNRTNTVMSYTGNWRDTLGPFDIQAIQAIYGDASSDVNWSWNPATAELTQIGKSTNDTIFGTGQRDVVRGEDGDDRIDGYAGADWLDGGNGDDLIFGGAGDDVLVGGRGNDTLIGSDFLSDGNFNGFDTVDYSSSASSIYVDLYTRYEGRHIQASASGADIGTDTLYGIRKIIGTNFDDVIRGSEASDVLLMGAGNDSLTGGAGNDVLDGGAGQDKAFFSDNYAQYSIVVSGLTATLVGPDGTDVVSNVETFVFNDRAAAITGAVRNDDFNSDSEADILWRHDSGAVLLWNSTPAADGGFAGQDFGGVGNDWHIQDAAEFNGDGKADILWRHDGGAIVLWDTTPAAGVGFAGQDFGVVANDWHIQEAADFNGDGKADLLWRHDNGAIVLWNSTPAAGAGFAGQDFSVVGNDWHIQDAADFNSDGKADILWRHYNGTTYLWNSTPAAGVGFIGQDLGGVGNDWHIQEAADFNGDGKADILWRHDNSTVGLWNSTPAADVGFTSQNFGIVGNDWHIQA